MKRFYRAVSVIEEAGGFAVALDGRPMRTPRRRPFAVPYRALAEAVAAEWGGQGDEIELRAMRLTGFANAALDRIAVTTGPGSFTGLRVGLSAARGIALAADRPAVGVTTLAAFAAPIVGFW